MSTQHATKDPKVLFEAGIHPKVKQLNFNNLQHKLTSSSESEMSLSQFQQAEQEYRRFLSLKKMYPSVDLVPSKLVDKFWHTHILDTKAYREDCQSLFGYFLDHYPYFGIYGDQDHQALVASFDCSKKLYEHHFGQFPAELNVAARCQEHACHVPSSCACRSPGACK